MKCKETRKEEYSQTLQMSCSSLLSGNQLQLWCEILYLFWRKRRKDIPQKLPLEYFLIFHGVITTTDLTTYSARVKHRLMWEKKPIYRAKGLQSNIRYQNIKISLGTECPSFPIILCNRFWLTAISTKQWSSVMWISPSQWPLLHSSWALHKGLFFPEILEVFLFFGLPFTENLSSTVNLWSISLPRHCGVLHCLTGL